jgi:hypothetical protein
MIFLPGAFTVLLSPVYLLVDAAQSFIQLWA